MKNKRNPLKIKKTLTRNVLILVILIVLISILLLIFSLSSGKKSSVTYKTHNNNYLTSKIHRRFSVESNKENIYNLGDYNVNLNQRKHLILNISVQCTQDSFKILVQNNIIIQNAVLEAFANYSSIYMASTNEGKEQIKRHILGNINNALHEPIVTQIYFNKFIIQ